MEAGRPSCCKQRFRAPAKSVFQHFRIGMMGVLRRITRDALSIGRGSWRKGFFNQVKLV